MKPREVLEPQGDCPYQLGLFVDLTGKADAAPAHVAVKSADSYFRRIPSFSLPGS